MAVLISPLCLRQKTCSFHFQPAYCEVLARILGTTAVEPWRLRKIAFKSANETGSMLVAGAVGDFLDAHIAVPQKVSCMMQPLLGQHTAEPSPG